MAEGYKTLATTTETQVETRRTGHLIPFVGWKRYSRYNRGDRWWDMGNTAQRLKVPHSFYLKEKRQSPLCSSVWQHRRIISIVTFRATLNCISKHYQHFPSLYSEPPFGLNGCAGVTWTPNICLVQICSSHSSYVMRFYFPRCFPAHLKSIFECNE